MVVIRKEQMDTFDEAALKRFEGFMIAHLREHFPKSFEMLDESQTRWLIRQGTQRAKEYEFTTEHEVCLFIDLTVMLGVGFDTDPQLPWAAETLNDESITNPTERIDGLYDRAMAYLDRVVGPDQVFPVHVYRRAEPMTWEEVQSRFAGEPVRSASAFFRELWPAKCDVLGTRGLRALIGRAQVLAGERKITETSHIGLYSAFMFIFGHDFARDPLYPIFAECLDGEEAKRSPPAGLRRLVSEGKDLLATKLAELRSQE